MRIDMFTADAIVEDVLTQYPQTQHVFIKYHMACIGCSMASFSTLHEAASAYWISLEQFLYELNEAVQAEEQKGCIL